MCKKQHLRKIRKLMKKRTWLEKLANKIVAHGKTIEKFFVVAIGLAILAQGLVGVNYDLTKYLPAETPAKQGITVMEREFGYPGTARVMIKDVSLYEAEAYKNEIAKIAGVDQVSWLPATSSAYSSEGFLAASGDLRDYYNDRQAVMDVIFEKGDSDPETAAAVDAIRELLGEKVALSGPAVSNKTLNDNVASEMPKIMICAVIVILAILILTTNSWFEPVLFMATMGIAIILNMGSNLIFGEISFLSSSVAAVLQLAVAMDYSIFLLHTFTYQKAKGLSVEAAIKKSLTIVIPSILASALTTMIGFLALALMKFRIGADMGLVLAKSIVWSLLTVVLLMPTLIVRWHRLIEKTSHRPFIPSLEKLARASFKSRWWLVAMITVILVPAWVAQGMNTYMYGTASMSATEGSQAYAEKKAIEEAFGKSNTLLIIVPNKNVVLERQLSEELTNLAVVKSVTSLAQTLPSGLPSEFLPNNLTEQLQTSNYARILLSLRVDGESEETFAAVEEIKALTRKIYGENEELYFVGETPATQDIKTTIIQDYQTVNLLSLLGVGLIILLSFQSLSMAVIVVVPIEVAVIINTGLPYIYGETLSFLGYLMVSSMQLGATVDYSILLTNNYLAERRQGVAKKAAAIKAIGKSALSIMTSGTVLTAVGYAIYFVSSVATIGDLGRLIGRGAFISVIMVLCLLPFLLTLSDELILRDQAWSQKILNKLTNGLVKMENKNMFAKQKELVKKVLVKKVLRKRKNVKAN